MTRRVLALLLLLAVAGGCTRTRGTEVDTTLPPETSVAATPPTSAPPDVATIPPVIDDDYLNRVLAALDEIDGQATRIIVEQKKLAPAAAELLAAIYDDEQFSNQSSGWLTVLGRDPSLSGIKANPGPRVTTVERIISRSPVCIWLAVTRDYSAVSSAPGSPGTEYLALRLITKDDDPKGLNPTAWIIEWDGLNEDGSEPTDRCRAA